jgi:hypothetical protein
MHFHGSAAPPHLNSLEWEPFCSYEMGLVCVYGRPVGRPYGEPTMYTLGVDKFLKETARREGALSALFC